MDDDNVDLVGPDVGEQCLQCRPVHIAAREPAIVIASSGHTQPSWCWLRM